LTSKNSVVVAPGRCLRTPPSQEAESLKRDRAGGDLQLSTRAEVFHRCQKTVLAQRRSGWGCRPRHHAPMLTPPTLSPAST